LIKITIYILYIDSEKLVDANPYLIILSIIYLKVNIKYTKYKIALWGVFGKNTVLKASSAKRPPYYNTLHYVPGAGKR